MLHSVQSVQSLSHVRLFATPWTGARQASLSITNSRSSLKLTSIKSVMPSSHLILCRPLLLLPPIPPSIRVFSNDYLFTWGGQSTGVSALASVLPKNTQDWSPLEWTGWISLLSKGLSRVFSNTTVQTRLVITFLPRSKRLLISWLQSPSAVILEPRKIKSDTVSTVAPSISHEVMGPDAMIFVFWIWALSQLFHSPLSLSSRGFLVPLHFLP